MNVTMRTGLRILLVDDHALVRNMLAQRLEQDAEFTVVGTADNAEQGLAQAIEHQPQVVLMDIDMPGMICFEAAKKISQVLPDVRMIFLSAYTHDHYIDQALKVGAMGYLTKGEPPERVIEAIRDVWNNRAFFSDEVRQRIVLDANEARLAPDAKITRASTLTPREIEVLRYIARGLAKKEIAGVMHVSVKTVEKHTDNLMHKLDIHDRVDLARFAIREGLAEP